MVNAEQLFVVPDLQGRPSGGTLYNRHLLAALAKLGVALRVSEFERAEALLRQSHFSRVWLDSLYIDQASALRAALTRPTQLGLVLHYLPSLVTRGDHVTRRELSPTEQAALEIADFFLVPSQFMTRVLERLGFGERPILCVEPGCELTPDAPLPGALEGVQAALVAHVVPGKGLETLLRSLAGVLRSSDRFTLRVLGDTRADPPYAARCQALVAAAPELTRRVSFSGLLSQEAVHAELMRRNLLLSASSMESYGMALDEGRRIGLPLLACAAGNVSSLVDVAAGGELVEGTEALAEACVRLCRDAREHQRRLSAARASIPSPRSWHQAALQFAATIQGWEARPDDFA